MNCAPPPARCRVASELLAIPRQRLDHLGAALPRGLKANTHAHHRRFSHLSRRPDAEGFARTGRPGQPPPHGVGRTHPAVRPRAAAQPARPLCRARGQAEGLKALQRPGAAQCHRARPRAHATAGRARPPRASDRSCSVSTRASPIAASCCRRCPIAACSRAALPWCATNRATPCMPPPRSDRARICRSNSPTAASAPPRMRIGPRPRRPPRAPKAAPQRSEAGGAEARRQAGRSGQSVLA